MAFDGGCLCGRVRYRIERTHMNAVHCYCQMCRKAHGGAFSTHVAFRPQQIVWLQGQDQLVSYESSPGAYREFCGACGTHVLVHGQTGDDTLAIPAGTLDGDPPLTLVCHIFVADQVRWFKIADDLPQHAGWMPGVG